MDLEQIVENLLLIPLSVKSTPNIEVLNENINFKPACKRNVTYIVSIVLINDKNEVCLVQEAKQSCRGKWYLPAGRMEPNENLCAAVIRECEEEAGYLIDPLSLFCIEIDTFGLWYRFNFIGIIKSGELKTIDRADKESLQAKWFNIDKIFEKSFLFQLRAVDILKIIELAVNFYGNLATHSFDKEFKTSSQSLIIPLTIQHDYLCFVCIILDDSYSSYLVCANDNEERLPSIRLPYLEYDGRSFLHNIKDLLLQKCFDNSKSVQFNFYGIIQVSFDGMMVHTELNAHNGIQLVMLMSLINNEPLKDPYKWHKFNNTETISQIKLKLENKIGLVNLKVY